jgi:YHS domain-containing protein
MTTHETFDRRIQERLARYSQDREATAERIKSEVQERQRRKSRFEEIAGRLLSNVIEPLLQQVARQLGDAEVTVASSKGPCAACIIHVGGHSLSATLTMELGLSLEGNQAVIYGTIDGQHHSQPIHHDARTRLPFDRFDGFSESTASAWIEERVLQFVDYVLELRKSAEMEIDPVCGTQVHPLHAQAKARIGRRDIYFCSEYCLELFQKDPQGFLSAKPRDMSGSL